MLYETRYRLLSAITCAVTVALGSAGARAQPELDSAAASDDSVAAREHFAKALGYVDQGAFNLAVSEFEQAYRAHPHPSVLYNLGLAHAQAGDAVLASVTLERYLAESVDVDAQRKALVEAVLTEQLAKLGEVTIITVPNEARISVGDKEFPSLNDDPVRLPPGRWTVVVAHDGYRPSTVPLTIKAGEHRLVHVELAEVHEPVIDALINDASVSNDLARSISDTGARQTTTASAERVRTTGYVVGATGIAAVAAAVGVYVWSSDRFDSWQQSQNNLDNEWLVGEPYPANLEARQAENDELARDVQTGDRLAIGLGVGGGVLLAVSLPLLLWTGEDEPSAGLQARAGNLTWRTTW